MASSYHPGAQAVRAHVRPARPAGPSAMDRLLLSRGAIAVASLLLFYALYLVNRDFAAVDFSMYGFGTSPFSMGDIFMLAVLTLVSSAFVPREMDRPSSLILIVVYLFILVPFQVSGLTGRNNYESERYVLLLVVHACYAMCAYLVQDKRGPAEPRVPRQEFMWMIVILWLVTSAVIFYLYRDIMSFANLDSLYLQRSLGKAKDLLTGYVQLYNQYVFSTALVVLGLFRRNIWLLGMGIGGALLNYSVSAEKAGLTYPIFILGLYFALGSGRRFLASTGFVALAMACVLIIAATAHHDDEVSKFVLWYLGCRTFLTPGSFILLYQDYFASGGPTYFAHIRGLNLFIPPPDAYASDPRWPSLGHMVGEIYLGIPDLNANANFIASDGVAGLGLFGVAIVFLLFAAFLRFLDKITNGIDNTLLLPILLPIALTLTNGSLFTVLTSFGGLFWIVMFQYMFVTRRVQQFQPSFRPSRNHDFRR